MTHPHAAVKVCKRIESALEKEDPVAIQQLLRELADLLETDSFDDPMFDIFEKQTRELADRVGIGSDIGLDNAGGLPSSFKSDVTALIRCVCQRYLKTTDIGSDALPALSQDPDDLTTAVETAAEQQAELEAQTVLWAALAKSVAAERDAAAETIEQTLDALSKIDTDRSRLEQSREGLKEAMEREREAAKRSERIDEMARKLGSDDE
jgi:hypothetical protein